MNTNAQPHQCANPQCKVAVSGRCLEGLEFENCPTYGRERQAEVIQETQVPEPPSEDLIELRAATSLELLRASDLLRRHEGRVIAIIGPREAGKTSLIASLFDLFQQGPVAGIAFAGSETMHAFELACHDSRTASRRVEPVQERTGHGKVRFYHLNLADSSKAGVLTLLIGDRAGEEYRTAADDVSQAGPFPEVSRADTVTVLVDGQRLLDNKTRHNARSETGLMLRALANGGFLAHSPRFIFALTKLDLVNASRHKDRVLTDFDTVVKRGTQIVSQYEQGIESFQIAAAPADTSLARGTGVDKLLHDWISPKLLPRATAPQPAKSDRAILNLRMPTQEPVGTSS